MACPEFVGPLLIPCDRRSCAINLNTETVFASGGDLAGSDAAARARSHAEDHSAEVFGIHRRFDIVFRPQQLIGKGLDGVFWLLARCVKRLEVGTESSHT